MSVFTTKVQSIGPEAELFKEEKMVLSVIKPKK